MIAKWDTRHYFVKNKGYFTLTELQKHLSKGGFLKVYNYFEEDVTPEVLKKMALKKVRNMTPTQLLSFIRS